jgi:UDP:flavonoid glycosyltransferase YjiC (YdhE family)
MNLTFVSLGSLGDVAPLIAVAERLQARGHSCELLSNQEFIAGARARGLKASSVAPPVEIFRHVPRFEEYLYCSPATIAEQLGRGASSVDLVVNCDRYCASNLVAEKYGLSVARLHLSPFKLRPYDTGRTPSYDLFARNPRVLGFVNQLRGSFGLDRVATAFHDEAYVVRHVATFPSWFCPAPPSAAPPVDFVGFPLPPERVPLPPELGAFIQRRGRPLVFTFGTANRQLEEFIQQAEHCCQELRLPGVVLCPRGVGERRSSEQLLLCPFLPLGAVLPEARLLVHHGGIGTTARALEAGVPQVILPQRFDQPDNGARCETLGVGSVLEPAQATPLSLLRAIRGLLDNAGVSRRAAELRGRIEPSQGLERFADSLEASGSAPAKRGTAAGAGARRACGETAIAG